MIRASAETLAAWERHVRIAEDFRAKGYTTLAADVKVILAMDGEIGILRASNEALRQMREGENA